MKKIIGIILKAIYWIMALPLLLIGMLWGITLMILMYAEAFLWAGGEALYHGCSFWDEFYETVTNGLHYLSDAFDV